MLSYFYFVLIGGQWYLIMVLICISLMTSCVTLTFLVTQVWLCDSRPQSVLFKCEKQEEILSSSLFGWPQESDIL